jgi:hypothetical protein
VPIHVARAVWGRDGGRCTYVDAEGRRCGERRFLTIEHRTPFAFGGSHTLDNLCLLCCPHNLHSARQVFGESLIQAKIRARTKRRKAPAASEDRAASQPASLDAAAKLQATLCQLGFQRSDASAVVGQVLSGASGSDVEQLLRKCLLLLVPAAS